VSTSASTATAATGVRLLRTVDGYPRCRRARASRTDPRRIEPPAGAHPSNLTELAGNSVRNLRPRYVAEVEQRISLITLGVAELPRARTFYERLGWRGQELEETVFFQAGGLALVLWGRDKVAGDAGLEHSGTDGFGGMALAHNVRSRAEVDEVLAQAADAGAEITRAAGETFYGGYAGFCRDPDGHVWEIAYNPGFPLDPDGAITVPDFGAA
jgi:uncharacterized protein